MLKTVKPAKSCLYVNNHVDALFHFKFSSHIFIAMKPSMKCCSKNLPKRMFSPPPPKRLRIIFFLINCFPLHRKITGIISLSLTSQIGQSYLLMVGLFPWPETHSCAEKLIELFLCMPPTANTFHSQS